MVLNGAKYKRQNDGDADFEDIMDTNIHTSANSYIPSPSQRTGSIINSNSISLGGRSTSTSATHQPQQLSSDVDLNPRSDSTNDDNLSFGSDRLCTAPDGHVRFVNSTIRYHMAGPGFW